MTRNSIIERKLDRLAAGRPPRVLELCSGCGGLGLGLRTAGFELKAHIECDPDAAATYARNLASGPADSLNAWRLARDMTSCSIEALAESLEISESPADAFDVVAAGLPCQAFARIGRSKLRSVARDEQAFKKDPRANLYRRFLEFVRATKPLAILIENVPDILNFGGHNVPEEICAKLEALGYDTAYTLLNAAFYGVPQVRERLILVGLDRSLGIAPAFPGPTTTTQLLPGYTGLRTFALKHLPEKGSHFVDIPERAGNLPPAISVLSALEDLPFISEHFRDPEKMRVRRVLDRLPYRPVKKLSAYAREMREWPGFETGTEVDGHVVRRTPRDFPIFQAMPHGSDYPKAHALAEHLFMEQAAALAALHPSGQLTPYRRRKLRQQIVPPYNPDKFPNKWWKLMPTAPSRTLTAHMGKDTYSHIHYDSRQKRTVSVREAARLQSFPDGFAFVGSMNSAFRQIGNAVPPLLALAVGRTLLQSLAKAIRSRRYDVA